jgi:hypothetical protein
MMMMMLEKKGGNPCTAACEWINMNSLKWNSIIAQTKKDVEFEEEEKQKIIDNFQETVGKLKEEKQKEKKKSYNYSISYFLSYIPSFVPLLTPLYMYFII